MTGIAVRNATIIDATGGDPRPESTIVVASDGTITAVGPDADIEIPQGTQVIDGTGKYVIPGLMDANVHLVGARTADSLLDFEGRYHELACEAAELTLKYGVTTVFDTWGPAGPLATARDAINAGAVTGSRVYFAGNIIGLGGPLTTDFVNPAVFLERERVARINEVWERGTGSELSTFTAEQVADRVEQYIEETAVDFVKWAITDHNAAPGNFYMFLERASRAIVETARKHNKTVQAHTTTVEGLQLEVDLDAEVLQHGDVTAGQHISEELFSEIVAKKLPTASIVLTDKNLEWGLSDPAAAGPLRSMRKIADDNQRMLIAKGARILLTTDGFAYGPRVWDHPGFRAGTLSPSVPEHPSILGYSHFNWMKGAWEKGLKPMEVLRSATAYIAEAYRVDDRFGTLVPGKQGDLVVLNEDPLNSHEAYRAIHAVVKGGLIVDRDRLGRNLQLGSDVIAEYNI